MYEAFLRRNTRARKREREREREREGDISGKAGSRADVKLDFGPAEVRPSFRYFQE